MTKQATSEDVRRVNVGVGQLDKSKPAWAMFLFPDTVPPEYQWVAKESGLIENVSFHIYALPSEAETVRAQLKQQENATAFASMLRASLAIAENLAPPVTQMCAEAAALESEVG